MQYPKHDYKEYPKTLPPDDFWGQVRRTVHGKPVTEEQIQMIVTAIAQGLKLSRNDFVLDLACGNGALSSYFFEQCAGLLGVDYSEFLISVAKNNFEKLPDFKFICSDAYSYVASEPNPERFTKVLCYGSFSFFPVADAKKTLLLLRSRFINVQKVFIGNLPDKDRTASFYPKDKDFSSELLQNESQIGIWRSKEEFSMLAKETGWDASFSEMPKSFFAAHYRYDVLLHPIA